jgi:osmotically inducible protein OsmC
VARVRRTADVSWEGSVARGKGFISGRSGGLASLPYSEPTRIGEPEGNTSPEELLAAAHAGCYAMSLAAELTKAGTPPDRIDVSATATLDRVEGAGHRIVAVDIDVRARVPAIDSAALERAAQAADEGCTFSHLVKASAEVSVQARLEEG